MSDRIETPQGRDVLDESLARLAATGPEFRGGLSNHGPMAAEAMIRLGRPDDVEPWLNQYIHGLEEAPSASGRITDQTWRNALGARRRVADWELYLRDQLAAAALAAGPGALVATAGSRPGRQCHARHHPHLARGPQPGSIGVQRAAGGTRPGPGLLGRGLPRAPGKPG